MNKKNNYIKLNPLALIVIIFLFGIIIYKLIYVAVSPKVDGIDLKAYSSSLITEKEIQRANRGTIYDINGEALAQNVRCYTIVVYLAPSRTTDLSKPRHVIDKEGTAKILSEHINMSEKDILKLLNQNLYQTYLGIAGKDISELKKQEIENLELPGIGFEKGVKRNYPFSDFASYILGYARKIDNGEIVGEMGIESKYNDELKGKDGSRTYIKDTHGYQIPNTPETLNPSVEGYDIHLTLDYNIQMYLENTVRNLESKSEWVTITIADAKTGAIVGSATSPSFDPNIVNIEEYNNPLTSYSYEPGSTMKIFSFMAAMENGLYKGDEEYQSGSVRVGGFNIRDWNGKGWGKITFDRAFTYSANTAAVELATRLGTDKLVEYYEKLGFGAKTGIELPNEYEGKVEIAHKSELANASFGQGLSTTPIQNIQALTSISNKGTTLKPYVIAKIVDKKTGEIIYEGKRAELNKVASEETINKIKDLMDLTVNGTDTGITGKKYHTDTLTLIGKTGTAEYFENGKYAAGDFNNIKSFAGLFPKEEPEYIIYISVKKFIGESLAPSVKEIVENIATYKNLADRPSDIDYSKIVKIHNYLNKSKDEVVSELESFGLSPIVIGNGEVIIRQYPLKNTSIIKGAKVFLVTNGSEIVMPNAIGWTSAEIISFANIIKLPYTITGYGNVSEISIKPGDLITGEVLDIILKDNRSR